MLSLRFAALFSGYGILLDIQVLGKNIFMNLILLGVTDIPSKLITYFIIRNVRRRPSVAFTLLTIGSCIAITIFIPEGETSSVFRISFLIYIHVHMAFPVVNVSHTLLPRRALEYINLTVSFI